MPRRPCGIYESGNHLGFTFVEVMVVSIIIAILAAAAVPLYTGYITLQRKRAALALAQTASITASSLMRRSNGVAPSDAQLNAALSLPNPAQFTVQIQTHAGVNYVVVSELSDPGNPAKDSAIFR